MNSLGTAGMLLVIGVGFGCGAGLLYALYTTSPDHFAAFKDVIVDNATLILGGAFVGIVFFGFMFGRLRHGHRLHQGY